MTHPPRQHDPAAPLRLILAAALRDAAGRDLRPAAIALVGDRILAVGPPDMLGRQLPHRPDAVTELPDRLLLPALVNAHAHLDLAAVGPQPFDGDFPAWLRAASLARPRDDQDVAHAVRLGLRLSHQQGVGFLGDIAFSPAAVRARLEDAMPGVSYIECFGPVGHVEKHRDRLDRMLRDIEAAQALHDCAPHLRIGISPHAPYTTSGDMYAHVLTHRARSSCPLTTHLAETPDEDQFIRAADGFFVEHLRHYDQWSDATPAHGRHPIDWMAPHLAAAPWLLAHCNYVEDHHLPLLARHRASVVYCPLASDYFSHPRRGFRGSDGRHRYRDMLAAGVNVCLGTDSILCQPPDQPQPHSILAPMRFLHQRDRTDPDTLLAMATVNGLRALEMDPRLATLQPGSSARIAAVRIDPADATDPLRQALENDAPIQPLTLTT
jgi:aminodeoxyfutalosine deaminase